jgi:iron(III) transport system permease protein
VRRDPAWTAITVLALATLALFLVWPLATTFAYSFRGKDGGWGLGGYATFFTNRAYRDSLWNTLILGGAVTATSMVVGGALAVLVARCQFRFAGWVAALPLVTLVIPDVVVAAAWTLILGQQGILNTWLQPTGWQVPSIYSWWGLIFVMTLNSYVYAFVMILGGPEGRGPQPRGGGALARAGLFARACGRDTPAHPAVDLRRRRWSSSRT